MRNALIACRSNIADVTYSTDQGKSVTVAITDRCTKCALTDLDFSYSAFDQIGDEAIGRLYGMTWVWAD